jgi:23S rRNA pseudouridine2605 synthase
MPRAEREAREQPQRIAKAIAHAGLCSRREAEHWIAAGRVAINGATIASPATVVTTADHITIDGKPLPETPRRRLWRYHKPPGLVTTHSDPQGRPTVFERLPEELGRVISVGRLDLSSEGLLLLTNDGGLARHLELPSTGWTRRYRVRAHGSIEPAALDRLQQGLTLDGIRYGRIDARLERQQGSNVWLAMALQEGKNREVRKVLEALDLRVNRLIRIAYGPFQLGNLGRGEVAEVSPKVLREQLGKEAAT